MAWIQLDSNESPQICRLHTRLGTIQKGLQLDFEAVTWTCLFWLVSWLVTCLFLVPILGKQWLGPTSIVCTQIIVPVYCIFTADVLCQSAGWHVVKQRLTMRWMCCRAGVWGCCSPLGGCVAAGSGRAPWAGLETGLRSPLAWIFATDSSLSSASVLPDPTSPGRPGTSHSLWLSSIESPKPEAPWRRSRISTRRPGLYSYYRK